uniref:RNase H domain-containing protein n=1 Tax=Strongyloides venezuelensis TaxID=75913 RepID=A0A0K0FD59_STRVS
MNVLCKLKKNRQEDVLYDRLVVEKIGDSIYKIESEGKYWVRKIKPINFLDQEGKIAKVSKIVVPEVVEEKKDQGVLVKDDDSLDVGVDFSDTLEKVDLIKLMQREDIYPRARSSDGSCEKGRGFGFVVNLNGKNIVKKSVRCGNNSTAQFLEIVGAVQCLKEMVRYNSTQDIKKRKAFILLDSSYAARALSEDLRVWTKNNFLKTDGSKLVHERFIREARSLLKTIDFYICRIHGYKDIELNVLADKLARKGDMKFLSKAVLFTTM